MLTGGGGTNAGGGLFTAAWITYPAAIKNNILWNATLIRTPVGAPRIKPFVLFKNRFITKLSVTDIY